MSDLSEEEILDRLTNPQKYSLIEIIRKFKREGIENFIITKPELLQGLIDLYNKEKEKNKEAIKWIEKVMNNGKVAGCNLADLQFLLDILKGE